MSDPLQDYVATVVRNPRISTYNEDATKQSIILPLLQLLGWSIFDAEEVTPEYTAGTGRVDYALRIEDQNKVFIEAKRCGVELENHQKQLLNYAFQQGVRLAVLTNGITWWFYLPLREGVWEQRKFYSIDLKQQAVEDVATRLQDFLLRDYVASGQAVDKAEEVITSRKRKREVEDTLPKAWRALLEEPDEILLELLREKVENLCGFTPTDGELHAFLRGMPREQKPSLPRRSKDVSRRRLTSAKAPSRRPPESTKRYSIDQLLNRDLRKTKPTKIIIHDHEVEVRAWSLVSVEFVRWMVWQGFLQSSRLPIKTYSMNERYFINAKASHKNPNLGGEWHEVEGVFVDTKFSSNDHIKNIQATLDQLGMKNLDVSVVLR